MYVCMYIISKTAMRWSPEGKRKRGSPQTTWRRTVEGELRELRMNWGQAALKAKDRQEWKKLVVALCTTRHA